MESRTVPWTAPRLCAPSDGAPEMAREATRPMGANAPRPHRGRSDMTASAMGRRPIERPDMAPVNANPLVPGARSRSIHGAASRRANLSRDERAVAGFETDATTHSTAGGGAQGRFRALGYFMGAEDVRFRTIARA